MKKQIVLYSETFKGYARLSEKLSGKERIGLEIKFTPDIHSATTFQNEKSKKHFIENLAIGVNYQFKTEYLSVGTK